MSYVIINRRSERLILTHIIIKQNFLYKYYHMFNNIQINVFFHLFCEFLSTNQICFCDVVACMFQSTAHFELQDNEH